MTVLPAVPTGAGDAAATEETTPSAGPGWNTIGVDPPAVPRTEAAVTVAVPSAVPARSVNAMPPADAST